jgi:hypothetical protein
MDFVKSHFGKMQLWIVEHFHLHKKVPVVINHNIRSVQLFRVAFFRIDFFQNPYFNTTGILVSGLVVWSDKFLPSFFTLIYKLDFVKRNPKQKTFL